VAAQPKNDIRAAQMAMGKDAVVGIGSGSDAEFEMNWPGQAPTGNLKPVSYSAQAITASNGDVTSS
jgi:hypothetical protein